LRVEIEHIKHTGSSIKLLLAEDDNDVIEITGQMISRKFPEITIYFADNGKSGLELFSKHLPDIIVSDVNMPVIGGIQMVSEIKAIKPDIKLIIITGHSDIKRMEKYREIGVHYYIQKPIMFNKLCAAIDKCIVEILQKRNKEDKVQAP